MICYYCDRCREPILDTMVISSSYGEGLWYCEPCADMLERRDEDVELLFAGLGRAVSGR